MAKTPDEAAARSIDMEAEHLRNEVNRLRAALRDETHGRRRHKRIPGNGATALLTTPGHMPASVSIHDLARGGVAVNCDWELPKGADVTVVLPGAQGVVPGHVVRSDGGMLAVMFQQDAESLAQLDRVLAWFDDTSRGGLTETVLAPTADGAYPNDMDAAVDKPPGAAAFGTATTSGILTDSKAIPFAEVRDGRFAFANPAFLSLFRADKDITGMSLPDLLATESRAAVDKLLADPEDTLVTFHGRATGSTARCLTSNSSSHGKRSTAYLRYACSLRTGRGIAAPNSISAILPTRTC